MKILVTGSNGQLGFDLCTELKKRNIDISLINVSFSEESPIIKDRVISSMIFTPNASGLALASYIIKDVIKEENK